MKRRIKKLTCDPSLLSSLFFPVSEFCFLSSVFCLLISVSGCSSYNESFDCPIGEGLKCASLSEVNQKIDAGEIKDSLLRKSVSSHPRVYWKSDLEKTSPPYDFLPLSREKR